jgi:hypothetical protein
MGCASDNREDNRWEVAVPVILEVGAKRRVRGQALRSMRLHSIGSNIAFVWYAGFRPARP